jgi:cytochrome b6-f complex iron-sulfur subunit
MNMISRRDILKLFQTGLTLTGLAAVFGPIVAYFFPANLEETPSEPVLVGAESDLPQGASKTVRFGRYPALVIHTQDGLRAYSAVCTHFACLVKWDDAQGIIACPCHQGYFSPVDGSVISGPPPAPLMTIPVKVIDGQIYVGGEA